jgi:hypothetical protein
MNIKKVSICPVRGPDNMEIVRNESQDAEGDVHEIQLNVEQHFKIKSGGTHESKRNVGRGSEDVLDEGVVDLPLAGGRDAWALCDLDDVKGEPEPEEMKRRVSTGYVTPTRPKGILDDDHLLEYPDTLECMYQNLETSFQPSHHMVGVSDRSTPLLDAGHSSTSPKIWVVKYVDYTSKYGLGFLLNTNSAGVYFNDSTKIILSPDGQIFQYIERRRRGSTGQIEHLIHTHSLRSYPADLTKKVTLLKHFKNYLTEQLAQQPQPQPSSASVALSGDDNVNPVWLNGYLEKTVVMQADTPVLPYVKKWVRTRHAILFRLSNRSVQVVFFDNRWIHLSPSLPLPLSSSVLLLASCLSV